MAYLKEGLSPEAYPNAEQRIINASQAKVLVLDDWGMEYGTPWEYAQLERIIAYRYRARLITIMASNKDIKQLEGLSERIVSRFYDPEVSQLVLNSGEDYRRRK